MSEDAGGTHGSDDPTDVRSVAVTTSDVVTALEARHRGGKPAVLRLTPPFAGRMRARLHVEGEEGEYGPVPAVHIHPEALVDPVPPYPEADATEDELRARGEYSPEAHREYHVEAVAAWRESVRAAIVARATIETHDGTHEVAVKTLG